MTRVLAALAGLSAAGCGAGGVAVSGTVTVGGRPLAEGVVAFEPAAGSGTTGAGAVTGVKDGRFDIPSSRELLPGRYEVRVSPTPPGSEQDRKTAPPQFKTWVTTVEVAAGAAPFAFEVPGK